MDKYDEIKDIISKFSDRVDFFDFGDGVSQEWIDKAEKRLNFKLPESYKWWLRNYSGGNILGEEIYSIYEEDFDTVVGGDIVFMYEVNKRDKLYPDYAAVICETDDEVFYFDLRAEKEDNEYPVYALNAHELYADDFIEFLKRRIAEI